jgi:type IV pilus assembly protein PilW
MRDTAMDRQNAKGFTLIELMIAMTIALLMAGSIVTIFVESRHSFNQEDNIQRMQDDGRFAIREISTDLSMIGFLADLVLPSTITPDGSLVVTTDCGPAGVVNWVYQTVVPGTNQMESFDLVDKATGATANAAFSCIDAAEIVPGTDIVATKRLVGGPVVGATTNATVYLRTNGTLGLLYREPALSPPAITIPAPFTDWEYRTAIYYVRNFGQTPGDNVPSLCRKILDYSASSPTMVTECIAQGIENLQIEYGLDTSGDGEPDAYVPNPTLAQRQITVSARVDILARAGAEDIRYDNDKTYTLSNSPAFVPNDGFYRRVYSLTAGIHNLRSLRVLRN